ncbi:alpha/beta fold hydrolase [Streptomyces sp. SID3343]|uniref:alpha/beta fold hydrolase n=1 Tax=Streptomyces sp. SID3343 TaxID=2690260 RepID=UPI00136FC5DE|nr:alpha/beta fold hydrolase [Streptomyces sp. SID3343]
MADSQHTDPLDSPSHTADLRYCDLPAAHPEADAAPLLLLHGYVGSLADWDGVAPVLAEERRVVAYDHRGHGGSTKFADRTAYTFDHLAADLDFFATRLLPDRYDLLGHSMGGVVALRHTLAHPERVRSLVLMDTAAEPTSTPLLRVLARGMNAAVGRWGLGPLLACLKPFTRAPKTATPQQRAQRERQSDALTGMDKAAFVGFGEALGSYPSLLGRLGEISCPVTVIVGEHDKRLRGAAEQFAAGIPGARLVVVAGAKHNPQTERPDAWLAAVREHFERALR